MILFAFTPSETVRFPRTLARSGLRRRRHPRAGRHLARRQTLWLPVAERLFG